MAEGREIRRLRRPASGLNLLRFFDKLAEAAEFGVTLFQEIVDRLLLKLFQSGEEGIAQCCRHGFGIAMSSTLWLCNNVID